MSLEIAEFSRSHAVSIGFPYHGPIFCHFRDKVRNWSKITIFSYSQPRVMVCIGILSQNLAERNYRMVWLPDDDTFSRCDRIPACDRRTDDRRFATA